MRLVPISASTAAGLAATATVIAATAGAAPSEADLQIQIGAIPGISPGTAVVNTPNGGTARITGLRFRIGGLVTNNSAEPASVTVRFEHSAGIRRLSGDADNCTETSTAAVCRSGQVTQARILGAGLDHWGWEVVAAEPGKYTWKAELSSPSIPDPVASNNASAITVIVTEAVVAKAAKITPRKPKAGALVSASVEIITVGITARPTALKCTGSVGGATLRSTPRAANGRATCLYHPPLSASGKTLSGVVSFIVSKTAFTKRFAVRLG